MAFVWLCATPCGATGLVTEAVAHAVTDAVSVSAPVRRPVPSRPVPADAEVEGTLHRGAVALVLAMAVVAAVSAGDARAIVGAVAPTTITASATTAVSSSAPDLHGGERPVPGRRDLA